METQHNSNFNAAMDFYGQQPDAQDSIEFDELDALDDNFGQNDELLEEDQFISESSNAGEGQSFD